MNTEVLRYEVDGVEMVSTLYWDAERLAALEELL